jgi:hypothetical protein
VSAVVYRSGGAPLFPPFRAGVHPPSGPSRVSRPSSSNRTCGFPASGSRTGFTREHAQASHDEGGPPAARRPTPRTPPPRKTAASRASGPCVAAAGTAAPDRRRSCRPPDTPGTASRNRVEFDRARSRPAPPGRIARGRRSMCRVRDTQIPLAGADGDGIRSSAGTKGGFRE